jgi:hypothetical protein
MTRKTPCIPRASNLPSKGRWLFVALLPGKPLKINSRGICAGLTHIPAGSGDLQLVHEAGDSVRGPM